MYSVFWVNAYKNCRINLVFTKCNASSPDSKCNKFSLIFKFTIPSSVLIGFFLIYYLTENKKYFRIPSFNYKFGFNQTKKLKTKKIEFFLHIKGKMQKKILSKLLIWKCPKSQNTKKKHFLFFLWEKVDQIHYQREEAFTGWLNNLKYF